MSHRIVEQYLDDLRRSLRHLPYAEQDAVLTEVRAHLDADVLTRRRGTKTLSADEAALQATNAFGAPDEIGVAYGPAGGVVRKSTGEVLLRVALLTGRAAGRGVKGVAKFLAIFILSLLGVALVFGIAVLFFAGSVVQTFQDDIREAIPHPVYSHSESWPVTQPQARTHSETFDVRTDFEQLTLQIQVDPETGCLPIQLVDPDGEVIEVNGTGCEAVAKTLTYTKPGRWQIRYTFVAFTGALDVQGYGFEDADGSTT